MFLGAVMAYSAKNCKIWDKKKYFCNFYFSLRPMKNLKAYLKSYHEISFLKKRPLSAHFGVQNGK